MKCNSLDFLTRKSKSNSIFGLDLLRVAAAAAVYLFHINTNLKFRTGVAALDTVISVGAVFMVLFFMLSGFMMSYCYGDQDMFTEPNRLSKFYKKRLFRIYPSYLLFLLIVFLFRLSFPSDGKILWMLIPVDLLGLQAFFSKGWAFLGNGGTWFVSVCLFLYMLYPFLQKLVNMCRQQWRLILFCYVAIVYISMARVFFGGEFASYYANPVFRIPEFVIGMIIGCRQKEKPIVFKTKNQNVQMWISLGICLVLSVLYFAGVTFLHDKHFAQVEFFKSNYLSYNVIVVPLFAVMILVMSNMKASMVPQVIVVPVKFLSELSFYFYLTQTLANRLALQWTKNIYCGVILDGDKKILAATFILNLSFAIVMYLLMEKGIHPILKRYSSKNNTHTSSP